VKNLLRDGVGKTMVLAAFGLALTILASAYLAYQLIVMGYPSYAGAAATLAGLVLGLCSAILLLRLRRQDATQKQLDLLMGDYLSPESTARKDHYIAELEAALLAAEEKLRRAKSPAGKAQRSLPL
jgi:hypothetical protein